ncbi:MAG: ABC transporter substrate-binding protein [Desulfobulbaceae bacterium]|nr:ABC transporter substrate-binding protein [Desulfobulbaceae bacterium]
MKRISIIALILLSGWGLALRPATAAELTKVRIGWQVPWATQGQLVQILKHTDILAKNGLAAEFIGRTYGPQLNEIALAGEIDVVLTADQPAATLFAKDKGWLGVGRLMYNRTLTYVPPKSPIKTMSELKDKTIALPVGAAAERITVAALKKAGLDPAKDVKIINLDIREQGSLVLGGQESASWGTIDALAGFDPTPAIFEARGLVKVLDVGKVCSLVLMNQEFIHANPGVATRMMQAMFDAYDYYRQHAEEANGWFMAEAGLSGADQTACNTAASIEPNLKAKKRAEMRVSFSDEDFKIMTEAAEFMAPKIKTLVDMRKYVSNEYVKGVK